jgi:hypothetical protein
MTPDEIDRILEKSANRIPGPAEGGAAMKRVEDAILKDLRPVRPLAPTWVFVLTFMGVFAALSSSSGTILGLHGIRALDVYQRALIFPTLLATAWLAAAACSREMRPAAGLRLSWLALIFSVGAFFVVFSLIFGNYSTQHLVPEGIPCLVAGLCVAIPTGLGIAWILRRGFVLDWSAAGMAAGALSGLTGLAMLELHCQNLKAIHVMVWHLAVVIVSTVLGFTIGRVADFFRRRGEVSR